MKEDKSKRLLTKGGRRRSHHTAHLLRGLPDLLPEFIAANPAFGGVRQKARRRIFGRKRAHGVRQLIVGEAVGFGGDKKKFAAGGIEKFQQLAVALLRRDIRVDERNAKRERGPLVQV